MRADINLGAILGAAAARPEMQLMLGTQADCPIGLADFDWVVFGFPVADVQRQGDIVMRGRWTRPQLEQCLASMSGGSAEEDPATGAIRFAGPRAGYWVAIDGPLAVVSTRDEVGGDHAAALLRRSEGPGKVAGALIGTLDRDATMWVAIDADAGAKLDQLDDIAPGTDAAVWARLEDGGLRGRLLGRFRSPAAAKAGEAYMRGRLDVVKEEGGDMLGKFDLVRKDKDVVLDAWIPQVTLGLATTAITSPSR
jgi:hypothetical protein